MIWKMFYVFLIGFDEDGNLFGVELLRLVVRIDVE